MGKPDYSRSSYLCVLESEGKHAWILDRLAFQLLWSVKLSHWQSSPVPSNLRLWSHCSNSPLQREQPISKEWINHANRLGPLFPSLHFWCYHCLPSQWEIHLKASWNIQHSSISLEECVRVTETRNRLGINAQTSRKNNLDWSSRSRLP